MPAFFAYVLTFNNSWNNTPDLQYVIEFLVSS